MSSNPNIYVFPDIHGDYDKLQKVFALITQHGFSLDKGDLLIQLGDRSDRGKDSYKVNEFFRELQMQYPKQVICLLGNHDRMALDMADGSSELMMINGGNQTIESYGKAMKIYGRRGFVNAFQQSGHYGWTKNQPLFYETPDYFFSHAPIPLTKYQSIPVDRDFRTDEHTLTWSYVDGIPETQWVDPYLIPKEYGNEYKICVYGHIHSGYYDKVKKDYDTPNPRMIGNSILLDSGSGCWKGSKLVCLHLNDLTIYDSEGNIYPLKRDK